MTTLDLDVSESRLSHGHVYPPIQHESIWYQTSVTKMVVFFSIHYAREMLVLILMTVMLIIATWFFKCLHIIKSTPFNKYSHRIGYTSTSVFLVFTKKHTITIFNDHRTFFCNFCTRCSLYLYFDDNDQSPLINYIIILLFKSVKIGVVIISVSCLNDIARVSN